MSNPYKTATAFRRALEDRLKAKSRDEGIDLQRLRRHVAFDRLLCRFFASENVPWVLKGGYAMELRIGSARTTKDIDLAMRDAVLTGSDENQQNNIILEMLQNSASKDFNDYFVFTIGSPILDLEAAPYGGARFPVTVTMDGRIFIQFHLDVGVGDIVQEPFEEFESEDWLGFAGIETGKFKGISREAQFAEKLHAYTLPREQGSNSRVKDLVDLVLLINQDNLDDDRLKESIKNTFNRRKTHELPEQLEPPPEFWTPVYQRLAIECGLMESISDGFELLNKYSIRFILV